MSPLHDGLAWKSFTHPYLGDNTGVFGFVDEAEDDYLDDFITTEPDNNGSIDWGGGNSWGNGSSGGDEYGGDFTGGNSGNGGWGGNDNWGGSSSGGDDFLGGNGDNIFIW